MLAVLDEFGALDGLRPSAPTTGTAAVAAPATARLVPSGTSSLPLLILLAQDAALGCHDCQVFGRAFAGAATDGALASQGAAHGSRLFMFSGAADLLNLRADPDSYAASRRLTHQLGVLLLLLLQGCACKKRLGCIAFS